MKLFKLVTLLLLCSYGLFSQSFRIKDYAGKIVNGDTIVVIFHPDQNHGWTELKVDLYVQNTAGKSLTLVAKKTEYNMHSDEYHSICFGGTCFDSSTFVSPFKDPVSSGGIDSTFSGHYRFDDLLHIPGRCFVAYTFYDDANNQDSAIVYVEYNTMQKAGVSDPSKLFAVKPIVWPNPCSDILNIKYNLSQAIEFGNTFLMIYNSVGKCLKTHLLTESEGGISIPIDDLQPGVYYCSISSGNHYVSTSKFHIIH